jgi:hypothetical protein
MSRFSPDPFHQAVRGARLHYAVALDRPLTFGSEIEVSPAPLAEDESAFNLVGAFTAVVNEAQAPAFTREFEAGVEIDGGIFDISFSFVNALTTVTDQPQTLVFASEIQLVVI